MPFAEVACSSFVRTFPQFQLQTEKLYYNMPFFFVYLQHEPILFIKKILTLIY